MAMRYALKALGKDTIVVIPACCWTVLEGEFPYTSLRVPLLHTAFETAASASSGVRAALKAGHDVVICGQSVDDLALALVAPLQPQNQQVLRHYGISLA